MKIKTVKHTQYISDEGFEFTFQPINDEVTITKTETGYEARYLAQDSDPMSPQEDGENALFLVGYHRDFHVEAPKAFHKLPEGVKREPGDKGHLLFTKQEVINIMTEGKDLDPCEDVSLMNVKDALKKYHVFGLEAYIHSGVVLALSREGNFPDRQWDVSQLGAVFVAKSEWPTSAKARKMALSFIETWNEYLSGDVYGIVKETYNEAKEQLDVDHCWGFYGHKYALEALKTEI